VAAYRQVDGLVTCELTACTPGSTPGPMLSNEYWITFFIQNISYKQMPTSYPYVFKSRLGLIYSVYALIEYRISLKEK